MPLEERDGVMGKVCTKCKAWKPVELFSKRPASRDGYQSQCKKCNNAPNTERQPIAVEFKECTICMETKPVSEFYPKKYAYDGYRSACKECVQVGIKESRERDIEAAREKERARHAAKRKERNETRRRFIAANLERHRKYMQAWREGNREKLREYNRKQNELYPERGRKAKLDWEKRNPAKRKAIYHRRRARIRQAEGSFTAREWEELKERYGNICLRCGRGEPEVKLTPDHVVALAAGGSNYIDNIQPLCRSCNSSKGAKHIDYRGEEG
jgi:5-methylcytosine-specific restriction endonuclease McrA